MSSSITIAGDTGIFYLPLHFELSQAGELIGGQIAFELVGSESAPVVVVLGGISAGRHVSGGWWRDLVGPGRAIDTERVRVLGVDFLGGAGASTGPGNWQGDGSFPLVTSTDQARAIALLLSHLGIARVHRFVGASYGGMIGLAFAADHGDRLGALVAIGAAHESHPMAMAWRSVQRRIVRFGQQVGQAKTAVALARSLAMTTYRSHEEFGQRFDGASTRVDGRVHFPVEDYLEARGEDFAARFSPDVFLALSQAIDLHRVDPARVQVPTLLVGFSSDLLVPIAQIESLAKHLGSWGRLCELPSRYGHDGFLKEVDALAPILRSAIEEEAAR